MQPTNNIDEILKIIKADSTHTMKKLDKLYVFITESSKNHQNLIWVNEPIHIIGDVHDESATYNINIRGHIIKPNDKDVSWTDIALKHNINVLFDKEYHHTPMRISRQEAIVEANDINYMLSKFRSSSSNKPFAKVEIWSVYELFKYMYHMTDEQKNL